MTTRSSLTFWASHAGDDETSSTFVRARQKKQHANASSEIRNTKRPFPASKEELFLDLLFSRHKTTHETNFCIRKTKVRATNNKAYAYHQVLSLARSVALRASLFSIAKHPHSSQRVVFFIPSFYSLLFPIWISRPMYTAR